MEFKKLATITIIEVGDTLDLIGNRGLDGLHGKVEVMSVDDKNKISIPEDAICHNVTTGKNMQFLARYIEDEPSGEWEKGELLLFDIGSINVFTTKICKGQKV